MTDQQTKPLGLTKTKYIHSVAIHTKFDQAVLLHSYCAFSGKNTAVLFASLSGRNDPLTIAD